MRRFRGIGSGVAALLAAAGAAGLAGCRPGGAAALERAEAVYQESRFLKDQIDLTLSRGADRSRRGVPISELVGQLRAARSRLEEALGSVNPASLPSEEDRRALHVMRRALEQDLAVEDDPGAAAGDVDCVYDPDALGAEPGGFDRLSERVYACFGKAAARLPFENRVLDRLTVFSTLPLTADPDRRRRLFLALRPVWESVDGRDPAASPYRRLVRLSAAAMRAEGRTIEGRVTGLGIDPAVIEAWLVSVLEAWRETLPSRPIDPWDHAWEAGAANRLLNRAVPLASLRPINDRFYRDLGADPAALDIQYDIEPRDGKDPVAFCNFGVRQRLEKGAWLPGEPWVFASYRVGGLDNLAELLHETGHGIHIAAIRARPAFLDWPDSDTFTEALADLAMLDMYEPEWQRAYLGAAADLSDSIRAKYAGIVMDIAWALFEIRLHRDPSLDPNRVWTDLTRTYLGIRPHPDLSWWAARGQLIGSPGYMLNYAAGAILIADLRARVRELRGPWTTGDPGWYAWVSERLFRFGLERPSRDVIRDFLGRDPSPRAILDDLGRARSTPAAATPAAAAPAAAAPAAAAPGPRFLALGDSYTIGEGVEPRQRWPVRLAALLRDRGVPVGDPEIVARTGWTTDELAAGIDAAAPRGPRGLVSLLIGVNDQYRGGDAGDYRPRVRALLERAIGLAGGDPRRVVVLSIPDWGVTPFAADRDRARIAAAIDRFNAVKREETARAGARWVDVTTLSRKAAGDASLLAADGLHPSGAQYAAWAERTLPEALAALGAAAGPAAGGGPGS
jgi:lysophospholipase L1-like esterase